MSERYCEIREDDDVRDVKQEPARACTEENFEVTPLREVRSEFYALVSNQQWYEMGKCPTTPVILFCLCSLGNVLRGVCL